MRPIDGYGDTWVLNLDEPGWVYRKGSDANHGFDICEPLDWTSEPLFPGATE